MTELTTLVARTEGPQPWRKIFHAVNGILIVTVLALVDPSQRTAVLTLGAITATLLAVDLARLSDGRANELFFRLFNHLASPREMTGLASSTWYALGVLLTAGLFARSEAISGVLVLGLADPAAAYVGRRWGKRPWMGGTVEGSLVCFLTCLGIVAVRHGWWAGLATAAIVTLVERRSWPLDDNLTIPIACAGVLTGIALIP